MSNEQLAIKIEEEQFIIEQDNSAYGRNIPRLMIYRAFNFSLAISVPTIVLFWRGIGLSMTEVMLLQTIFAISIVVLEVPSGYLADVLGRRGTLLSGAIFYLVGSLLYPQFSGFWGVAVVEVILALAISLISGADQAFLYDSLAAIKKEEEFSRIFGNMRFYEMFLTAILSTCGGFIADRFGVITTFYCSAAGFMVSILFALSLIEPPKKQIKKQCLSAHIANLLSVSKECLIINKDVRWQLLFSGFLFAMMQSSLWLYQPYWELVGIELAYFGICFAILNIVSGIAAKLTFKLSSRISFESLCLIMVLLLFASYVGMANAVVYWGASFALLQQIVRGIMGILFSERLNLKIGSEYRATLISLQSLVWRFIYSMVLIPIGLMTDSGGLIYAMKVLSVVTIVVGLMLMSMYQRQ